MADQHTEQRDAPQPVGARSSSRLPGPGEVAGWHLDVLRGFLRPRSAAPSARSQRLIESLGEVAEAISSRKSTTEVLTTVVDEAKRMLGTDKAVLCLLSTETGGLLLDETAVFVRGRRDQYPEEWWRARIADVATDALEQRVPVVEMVDRTWLMTMPVKIKGRPIGVLAVMNPPSRRFTNDQVALLAVLSAFAGTAIENARLQAQSHYALLSDERMRIAREMHDGLSQSLFGTSLELDVCRKRVRDNPDEVAGRLDRVQEILVRSLSELRRYIHDLRPVSLNTLGLVGAMHQRLSEIGDARGVSMRVYTEGVERPLPPSIEACLYRVAQEAVTNVAKHADAKRAVVLLRFDTTEVHMIIEDDGHGFDVAEAQQRLEKDESIGLKSMRDRVQSEGGTFALSSSSKGTMLKVDIPC